MKKIIKINIDHFWKGFTLFDFKENLFPYLLNDYIFIEEKENPDIVFYTNGSDRSCMPDPPKFKNDPITVFFMGEIIIADISKCDFAFTYNRGITDKKHFRLPNYVTRLYYSRMNKQKLIKPVGKDLDTYVNYHMNVKKEFCNFIYSNFAHFREMFMTILSGYKRVDSYGKRKNNMKGQLEGHSGNRTNQDYWDYSDKLNLQNRYKFSIAMENGRSNGLKDSHGYVTEKLTEPMLVGSIPIYWGDTMVCEDFNCNSFIDFNDYDNINDILDSIIEIDNDKNMWEEMLREPWFPNNEFPQHLKENEIKKQFDYIFSHIG